MSCSEQCVADQAARATACTDQQAGRINSADNVPEPIPIRTGHRTEFQGHQAQQHRRFPPLNACSIPTLSEISCATVPVGLFLSSGLVRPSASSNLSRVSSIRLATWTNAASARDRAPPPTADGATGKGTGAAPLTEGCASWFGVAVPAAKGDTAEPAVASALGDRKCRDAAMLEVAAVDSVRADRPE